MSQMGHLRHFKHPPRTSASPPLATKLLRYGNRRFGPTRDVRPLPITCYSSGHFRIA